MNEYLKSINEIILKANQQLTDKKYEAAKLLTFQAHSELLVFFSKFCIQLNDSLDSTDSLERFTEIIKSDEFQTVLNGLDNTVNKLKQNCTNDVDRPINYEIHRFLLSILEIGNQIL